MSVAPAKRLLSTWNFVEKSLDIFVLNPYISDIVEVIIYVQYQDYIVKINCTWVVSIVCRKKEHN